MFNFKGLKNRVLIEEEKALAKRLVLNRQVQLSKAVVHDKITSPKMFVSAFLSGGAVGWFVTRPKPDTSAQSSESSDNSDESTSLIVKNVRRLLITVAANSVTKFMRNSNLVSHEETAGGPAVSESPDYPIR